MKPIRLTVGGIELRGSLDDIPLAHKVWELLPYETFGETWGKELYFPVAVKAGNSAPVQQVEVGHIAYWPDGPDLCIFFGPTPRSTGDIPVVASPVTVIGRFECDPASFDRMERQRRGIPVRVEPCQ
jgi:hypothetical protein